MEDLGLKFFKENLSPKFMLKTRPKYIKGKGFSLIELSIIILIIGIFITAVFVADAMVSKFRLAAAKTLTVSSPINSIKDTALWLETSLDKSFNSSETEDGTTVTAWYDQQNSGASKTSVVAVNGGPTYANTINRVHAVEFGKNGSTGYLKFDASFLNNTDYTIMVLEKRKSAGANLFLKSIDVSNADDNKLKLGYSNNNTVIHSQNNSSYAFDSQVAGYEDSTDKPRLFTFIQSSNTGKKTYINGSLAAQDATNTAQLSGITNLALGKGYTGEIGEIVIFTRALRNEELQAVQSYYSNKWKRSDNSKSAPSCVNNLNTGNYQVTETGCDLSSAGCQLPAESGFASIVVSSTSTPRTSPCTADPNNYSGNVTYTCINGTPLVTGHCTPAAPCSSRTVVGSTSQTAAIAHGASGSIVCNATNYSGATLNYTCSNGSLTPNPSCANNCAAGYTGSTCSSCSSAGFNPAQGCTVCLSNYDLVSGACVQKCSTPAATGIVAGTLVPRNPVAQNCNVSTYGGTFTYTCATAGGTATIATNSCVRQCTVSGITGVLAGTKVNVGTTALTCNDTANNFGGTSTGAYSCALVSGTPTFSVGTAACGCVSSDYTIVSGVCRQQCTLPAVVGIATGAKVPYTPTSGTTSTSCAAGYSGTINYTCGISGGTATINSGACNINPCTVTGSVGTDFTVAGKALHVFTGSGTLRSCPVARTANILVVGGGGGGGGHNSSASSGGGGGAVITVYNYNLLPNTTYTITVGASAAGGNFNNGTQGRNSSFTATGLNISAQGGGAGQGSGGGPGINGGSASGGHNSHSGGSVTFPAAGSITGASGSVLANNGAASTSASVAGGGGGATSGASGRNGGGGYSAASMFPGYASFAGGGTYGSGGGASGGTGGTGAGSSTSINAVANSGGGGAGGNWNPGGTGAAGIVIVQYW
jgi:Tfp pilus assembly protein PilE